VGFGGLFVRRRQPDPLSGEVCLFLFYFGFTLLALFWFTLPLFILFGLFPTKSAFSVLLLGAVCFGLLVSILFVFCFVSLVPRRCQFFVLGFCYSILCGGITD
jgi:hypothetical protein